MMMKLFRSLVCGLALTLASVCSAQTADELEKHVTYLASDELQGRYTASEGYAQAAEYVFDLCTEYGLNVEYQAVPTRFGPCKNVIAWIEGTDPNTVVVVGAHLDHVGVLKDNGRYGRRMGNRPVRVYNGADDNASGSAAILGLAKRFAEGPKPACTIVFQWYTGEEQHFIGSSYYVDNPILPENGPDIEKHIFMLNLDMVGRLRDDRPRRLGSMVIHAVTPGDFNTPNLPRIPNITAEALSELYEKHPIISRITFRTAMPSDQIEFAQEGIPVVALHTGLHGDYHRTTDDSDKINYDGMVEVCDYAYDLLRVIIGETVPDAPDYLIHSLPVR